MTWAVDETLRFACRGCTACCRGWSIPADAPFLAGLDQAAQRALVAARPSLAGRPLTVAVPGAGAEQPAEHFLASDGGRCLLLEPDGGCLIHRVLGYAAKPETCRLFPLRLLRLPGEDRLSVRPACSGYALSWQDGPLLVAQLPALVAEHGAVPERWLPRSLSLAPGRELLAAEIAPWLARTRAALAAAADLPQALAALGRGVPPAAADIELRDRTPDGPRLRAWLRTVVELEAQSAAETVGEGSGPRTSQTACSQAGLDGLERLGRHLARGDDSWPGTLESCRSPEPLLDAYLRDLLRRWLDNAEYRVFPDFSAALGSLFLLCSLLLAGLTELPGPTRLPTLASTAGRLLRSAYPLGLGRSPAVDDALRRCWPARR